MSDIQSKSQLINYFNQGVKKKINFLLVLNMKNFYSLEKKKKGLIINK